MSPPCPTPLPLLSLLSTINLLLLHQTREQSWSSFRPLVRSGRSHSVHLAEKESKGHGDPLPQVALGLTELNLGSGWPQASSFLLTQRLPLTSLTGGQRSNHIPTGCPLTLLDRPRSPSLSLASLLLASFCLTVPHSQRHLSQVVGSHTHPSPPRCALKKPRGGLS